MLTDIIKPSAISCSLVTDLTTKLYLNGSVSTAEVLTTLDSVTLPEGTFYEDGDCMDFEYCGTFAGDSDTQVYVYFGTDAIFDSGIIDPANESFTIRGRMTRTGPTTQYTISTLLTSTLNVVKLNSTTITFGPEIALEFKGIGTSGGAVDLRAAFRRFYFQQR
jgi:hypothetical protein